MVTTAMCQKSLRAQVLAHFKGIDHLEVTWTNVMRDPNINCPGLLQRQILPAWCRQLYYPPSCAPMATEHPGRPFEGPLHETGGRTSSEEHVKYYCPRPRPSPIYCPEAAWPIRICSYRHLEHLSDELEGLSLLEGFHHHPYTQRWDVANLDKWRPIALQNSMYKVYATVITRQ